MDKNTTAPLQQTLQNTKQTNLFQQTNQQQNQTAGAQFAAPQQIQQNQTILQGLSAAEQQTAVQAETAAPAPPVEEQRRKKSLKEKLTERLAARRERKEAERQEREAQQQRAAEEHQQRAGQERTQPQEYKPTAWQRERDQKVEEMDRALARQGAMERDNPFWEEMRREESAAWVKLSEEEREAIVAYTGEGKKESTLCYASMNYVLRTQNYDEDGGVDNDVHAPTYDKKENYQAIKHVISALEKSKLPRDLIFKRGSTYGALMSLLGVRPSMDHEENLRRLREMMGTPGRYENRLVVDRGFLSTSPFTNGGFEGGGSEYESGVEFYIQGHAGDEAIYIDAHSQMQGEGETLFQAGTGLRILKICEGENNNLKVYMETIPRLEPLRGSPGDLPQV